MEDAPTALLSKLNEIMSEVGQIEKTGKNTHFGYEFVEKDNVFNEFRSAFAEHDIQPIINVGEDEIDRFTSSDKDRQLTRVMVELTLVDLESGETLTYQMPGQGLDGQDKGVSKATGLAVKYLLLNNFLIDSGEDDPDAGSRSSSRGQGKGQGRSSSQGGSQGSEMSEKPGSVTDKQRNAIYAIAEGKYYELESQDKVLEGKDALVSFIKNRQDVESLNDLSKAAASQAIDWLKGLPEIEDPEDVLDDVDPEDDIPF